MSKKFRLMIEDLVAILLVGLMLATVGVRPLPVYANETNSDVDVGSVEISYQVVDTERPIVTVPSKSDIDHTPPDTGYNTQTMLYVILLTISSGIFLLYIDILQSQTDI